MPRIAPLSQQELSPSLRVAFERYVEEHSGTITNTQATLGHSLQAFEVYMQWYPLYASVEKILGKRLALLFGYSISNASSCNLCTAFFRKRIIEAGEDPENLFLSASQKAVMNFGSSIARHQGNIADHVSHDVAQQYNSSEIVTLLAFAGQMIAMNVFNNVVETSIDEYLTDYLPPVKYC